jgi:glutathione S-transferase
MYEIHAFPFASNSIKPIIVAEELGVTYELHLLDPMKGEHKTPEQLARHPLGKVPTLTHDGRTLFESAVICRYMAAVEKSDLYPADDYDRAIVDQWIDYFSLHLGRWVNALYFENIVRAKLGQEPKQENIDEALGFATLQAEAVDKHLGDHEYLCGSNLTIADLHAYAYMRVADKVGLSLDEYPAIIAWRDKLKARPGVARAEALVVD